MTYKATLKAHFDTEWTPSYGGSGIYDDAIVVQGRLDRIKFKDKNVQVEENFWCVVAPKVCGFHPGLTAVIDCEKYGLASRDNGVIRIGKTSFGRLNQMVKKEGRDPFFKPFHDLLRSKEK